MDEGYPHLLPGRCSVRPNVDSGNQNTLTPGPIRQYVLHKAYEYVNALGLDQIAQQTN